MKYLKDFKKIDKKQKEISKIDSEEDDEKVEEIVSLTPKQ